MDNEKNKKVYQLGLTAVTCLTIGTGIVVGPQIMSVSANSVTTAKAVANPQMTHIYEISSTDGKIHDQIVDHFTLHRQKNSLGRMIWVNENGQKSWPLREFDHYAGYTPSTTHADSEAFTPRAKANFVVRHVFLYPGKRSSTHYMRMSANLYFVDKKGKVVQTHIYNFMFPKGSHPSYKIDLKPVGNWKLGKGVSTQHTLSYGQYGFPEDKILVEAGKSDKAASAHKDATKPVKPIDSSDTGKKIQTQDKPSDKAKTEPAGTGSQQKSSDKESSADLTDKHQDQLQNEQTGQKTSDKSAESLHQSSEVTQKTDTAKQNDEDVAPKTDTAVDRPAQATAEKDDSSQTSTSKSNKQKSAQDSPTPNLPADPDHELQAEKSQTDSQRTPKPAVHKNIDKIGSSAQGTSSLNQTNTDPIASDHKQNSHNKSDNTDAPAQASDPDLDRDLQAWESGKDNHKKTDNAAKLPQTANHTSSILLASLTVIGSLISLLFTKFRKAN